MDAQPSSTHLNSSTAQNFRTPSKLASLSVAHTSKAEQTFEIRCPDRNLKEVIISGENGTVAFRGESKAPFKSWSVRRSLKDANEKKIYDLRHRSSKLRSFVIEDAEEKQLCTIEDTTPYGGNATTIDAQFGDGPDKVIVEIRSFDHSGIKTIFQVDGTAFAELLLIENNDLPYPHKRQVNRSLWKLRVAGGLDVALVLTLALCRVETLHVWKR